MLNEHDRKEIKKLKEIKSALIKLQNMTQEERIEEFRKAMRGQNMFFGDNDITWCVNSRNDGKYEYCDAKECFRHLSNRKKESDSYPDIYSIALLKDTEDCPYFRGRE